MLSHRAFGGRVKARPSHAASANRPAISLFTRCTVPLPTPTNAATLRMPFPALRCSGWRPRSSATPSGGRASSLAGARGRDRQEPCCE